MPPHRLALWVLCVVWARLEAPVTSERLKKFEKVWKTPEWSKSFQINLRWSKSGSIAWTPQIPHTLKDLEAPAPAVYSVFDGKTPKGFKLNDMIFTFKHPAYVYNFYNCIISYRIYNKCTLIEHNSRNCIRHIRLHFIINCQNTTVVFKANTQTGTCCSSAVPRFLKDKLEEFRGMLWRKAWLIKVPALPPCNYLYAYVRYLVIPWPTFLILSCPNHNV